MTAFNPCPKTCNLCGGPVVYVTNDKIYHGKRYGSGFAYLCTKCRAYTGTHVPRPSKALGILANAEMRNLKMQCHAIFDPIWIPAKHYRRDARRNAYARLAKAMNISVKDCHFGHFDKPQLEKALSILKDWQKEAHE